MTKKTFTILAIFLLSCMVFTGAFAGLAAQTEKNDVIIKTQVDTILSDYFQYREASIF